jgi:hypothetical protein
LATELSADANPNSLWDQAYKRLQGQNGDLVAKYESILAGIAGVEDSMLPNRKALVRFSIRRIEWFYTDLLQAVISTELRIINNRQWKLRIPLRHEPVVVRAVVEKLAAMAQRLQIVGSTVANIDPIHVGLLFAGICVLIQVSRHVSISES